jgi:hypothetical protein
MLGLFILIVVDYLMTYIGITLGLITEANPLMVCLFHLHLWPGLLIRVAFALGGGQSFELCQGEVRQALSRRLLAYTVQAAVMGLNLY